MKGLRSTETWAVIYQSKWHSIPTDCLPWIEHLGPEDSEKLTSATPGVNRRIISEVIIEKSGVSSHLPKKGPVVLSGTQDYELPSLEDPLEEPRDSIFKEVPRPCWVQLVNWLLLSVASKSTATKAWRVLNSYGYEFLWRPQNTMNTIQRPTRYQSIKSGWHWLRINFVQTFTTWLIIHTNKRMQNVEYKLSTELFISPSGISELDRATTKTDTAERSISVGRESLQVPVLPYRCSICAPLVTR